MDMKGHILAALREQFDAWETLLAGMNEQQITAPLLPSPWSGKDVVAHLKTWQERSIARLEAALEGREPEFPKWIPGVEPDSEPNTEQINAWIYETHRDQSWSNVYADWRKGYLRFLELGGRISEINLLAEGRYGWLNGSPLAIVLLASYDHHQEHLEKMIAWWQEHEKK
jgi:hypothetical protein